MKFVSSKSIDLAIDAENGVISSLKIKNREICVDKCPIFVIRFRDRDGKTYLVNSSEVEFSSCFGNNIHYKYLIEILF